MESAAQSRRKLPPPRRHPPPLQSPLSNTLVPRDSLPLPSPSEEQSTRYGAESSQGREYASLISTPSPDVDTSSTNPLTSNMPSISNPHSPRSLSTKINSDNPSHKGLNADTSKKSGAPSKESGKSKPAGISNTLKDGSAPALLDHDSTEQSTSPPVSPGIINTIAKDRSWKTNVAQPRKSSIDSAISSVSSSAEHSHKSCNDNNYGTSTTDIHQLISTAGSAETLIMHLIKEKQYTASQNGKLWKLVNKQRSLLQGLNQDLEHAIKDKERYRNKLRDFQSQVRQEPPPYEPDQGHPQLATEVVQDERQSFSELNTTPPNKALARSPDNSHRSPTNHSMVPSPLHLQNQQRKETRAPIESDEMKDNRQMPTPDSEDAEESASPTLNERRRSKGATSLAAQESFLASPSPQHLQFIKNERSDPDTQHADKATLLNERAEAQARGGRQKKAAPATARKAPPAPLNLRQASPNTATSQAQKPINKIALDQRESQNLPAREAARRGRRKTREDDDRGREVAAQHEETARSRSNKSSKSRKQKSKPASDSQVTTKASSGVAGNAMPSGTRQVAVQHPPDVGTSPAPAPGSIAAVLSPTTKGSVQSAERSVVAPPMSPGLPISPRPQNRPIGSPVPRHPRQGSGISLSPPTSPRMSGPTLLVSPRSIGVNNPATNDQDAMASSRSHQQSVPPVASLTTQDVAQPILSLSQVESKAEIEQPPGSPSYLVHSEHLMDPAYPKLLVAPISLSAITVRVSSSRLRPKRHSYIGTAKPNDEDPVFTLSILSRSNDKELWRVEKVIRALPQLDQHFKDVADFETPLPDRKLFSGHSPAIVDARRIALNHYFGALFEAAADERSAIVICSFLSSDVIEARDDETSLLPVSQRSKSALALGSDGPPAKEGYLTKRGKNFGGWKARYFVLQGAEFKYFESPGGTHLGTIKLQHARIGKQTQSSSPSRTDDDIEHQYRHAFLVLEPKRKDSSSLVRHVLCAESDQERDEWALALTQYTDHQSDDDGNTQQPSNRLQEAKTHVGRSEAKAKQRLESYDAAGQDDNAKPIAGAGQLKGVGYDQVTAGAAPTMGAQQVSRRQDASPSPANSSAIVNSAQESDSVQDQAAPSYPSKVISGPRNGGVIQDAGSWGNKLMSSTHFKDKKRGLWGFRHWNGSDHGQNVNGQNDTVQTTQSVSRPAVRACFGLPLAEAVALCHPRGVDVMLPAVVYRCIEYLRVKDAVSEEGIFRLSGSNIVVRSLRERFNTEGDVDLLAENQYYDIHAVASLFKTYLRELPSTVLTKELHLDFLHVSDLDERSKRVVAFNTLVHMLPAVNLALLRALSGYLIEIVNGAERNKMSIRNIGIVFSPTLNIPPAVFAMFLTDFEAIFGAEVGDVAQTDDTPVKTAESSESGQPTIEEIRSPRRQLFSDLPTPAYDQTSFPPGPPSNPDSASMVGTQSPPGLPREHRVTNETGFVPMQPSYETKTYVPDSPPPNQPSKRYSMAPPQLSQRPDHGSMKMMMAPAQSTSIKATRRESSMVFMGAGTADNRTSTSRLRDDTGMVNDDSAFE